MSTNRKPRRPDVTAAELIGGPERVEVPLHSYNDRWPDINLTHRSRIEVALAPIRARIEHIGSTSVPGLAAKPIVDIVVAVQDLTAEEDYLDPLISAGYQLRVREPGTAWCARRPATCTCTCTSRVTPPWTTIVP